MLLGGLIPGLLLSRAIRYCDSLDAVNLRRTSVAARDWELRTIAATFDGELHQVQVRVAAVAAYLLARSTPLMAGTLPRTGRTLRTPCCTTTKAGRLRRSSGRAIASAMVWWGRRMTAIYEMVHNFGDTAAREPNTYAQTMHDLRPELDGDLLANGAVTAVRRFVGPLQD